MNDNEEENKAKENVREACMNLSVVASQATTMLRKIAMYIRIREADGDDIRTGQPCMDAWSINTRVKCTRAGLHTGDHIARDKEIKEVARWTNIASLPSFGR